MQEIICTFFYFHILRFIDIVIFLFTSIFFTAS